MHSLYIGTKFIGHDAAVFAIIPERREVFAIANERLTRFKHDDLYPIPALTRLIEYCNINVFEISSVHVANSFVCQQSERYSPSRYELATLQRSHFQSRYLGEFKDRERAFSRMTAKEQYQDLLKSDAGRLFLAENARIAASPSRDEELDSSIRRHLKTLFPVASINISYFDHQLCHAASCLLSSPFDDTLLLTFDGFGDGHFSKALHARNGELHPVAESPFSSMDLHAPGHEYGEGMGSPGGVYHYFTYLLGFTPDADEGKVEALAAYGRPIPGLLHDLLDLFTINRETRGLQFNRAKAEQVLNYTSIRELMKGVKREDFAASVQTFLETLLVEYTSFLLQSTGARSLSISGGVAANVITNLRIFEEVIPNLYIVPAMADDGTAQGAAILQLLSNGVSLHDLAWLKELEMPYFGTSFERREVEQRIARFGDEITVEDIGESWPDYVAELVSNGEIGAIFHGRMEWGPRALGNRSIIADARREEMRQRINKEIKRRPLFQPFCPSMLAEEKDRLFEHAYLNKHMTCAFRMRPEFVKDLPSAVHIDATARVQFVTEEDNPNYYRLLKRMREITGYGVVINTSFNRHGRTIVESPEDAVRDFLDTDLGFLMIEGFLVRRK